MRFISLLSGLFLLAFSAGICDAQSNVIDMNGKEVGPNDIKTGAERTNQYYPWLKDKRIAVVANQTSMIQKVHLVDSLLHAGFAVKKVFCPEHGFRGN